MPDGFQVGGACYPDEAHAGAVYASSLPTFVVQSTPDCPQLGRVSSEAYSGAVFLRVDFVPLAGATTGCYPLDSVSIPYSPIPCGRSDPFNLSLEEGALIAGAVATVWVTAWCFKALRLALNTDGTSEREIS